jgi:hypothetical protein
MSNKVRTLRPGIGTPLFTTEADDIRVIVGYLGIAQSSQEAQAITGLSKSGISEVLAGRRPRGTGRKRHIAVVAAVIRDLAAARSAATGASTRGESALGWLYAGRVATTLGPKTPIEVLSNTDLALEALDDLVR